jgi:type IV pilus assembly protein PilB
VIDSRQFVIRTLLADEALREADVKRATDHASAIRGDVLDSLVALNLVTPRRLAIARAKISEYPFIDLAHYDVDFRNCRLLSRAVAERLGVFPVFVGGGIATVAMADPLNLQTIDQVRQAVKLEVDPVVADGEQLRALITRAYSMTQGELGESGESGAGEAALTTGEEPIVAAVNQILAGAAEAGASDVHLSPDESDMHLRYRVDGVLHLQQGPPKSTHAGIVQRLKVLARLDLAQTRRPQDGKFRFLHRGEPVDVRLSLVPTIHGENAVLRLLRSVSKIGGLATLGMSQQMTAWYEDAISRPHGMLLVTGPTGSGKTTTLYTALNHLNSPEVNIMTIEDPVEIRLPMIRQIQAAPEIGLTFATALRTILRQDPDIVLVGEIRDEETAKIAVQAAMTGHVVFSTLHTNDAIGAVARLRDLGVPDFAINGALVAVIAQRLVRKLCGCAVPETDQALIAALPRDQRNLPFQSPAGCAACRQQGYKGRLGVFEMFRMTTGVQAAIERKASRPEVELMAREGGMEPLWMDALAKAGRGLVSVQEVLDLRVATDMPQEHALGEAA